MSVPPQGYYVSWKLRLIVRLEEFANAAKLRTPPPALALNLTGTPPTNRSDLQAVPDPLHPGAFLLIPKGQTNPGTPKSQDETAGPVQRRSSDGLTFDVMTIPSEMSWNQNGIRTADTLEATIRYVDCPLDPRCIRSAAVEAYIGTVTEDDYVKGIAGKRRSTGELTSILPDSWTDANGTPRTNLRFQGWVSVWKSRFPPDDEPQITLTCKDNTALLIAQQAPPGLLINKKIPIDRAIADYLAEFPQMSGLSVQYLPTNAKVPVYGDVSMNTATRANLGPQPSKAGGVSGKQSVWDYLTSVCWDLGHTIRLSGNLILIQNMQTFTSAQTNQRSDDPYTTRTIDGVPYHYRTFIYGHNLDEMEIQRNYDNRAPTNVELRCYNNEEKRLLVSRYPPNNPQKPNAGRLPHAIPGNAQPDQKVMQFRVSGIKDQATLDTLCRTIFESASRSEFEVSLKTQSLGSLGGGNLDPDILDSKIGDTIELLVKVAQDRQTNSLNTIEKSLLSRSKGADFLKRLGFQDDFADAYAKTYEDAGFMTQFRLREMKVHCNVDDGIDISLESINFVEVRNDKDPPPDPNPPPAPPIDNAPQS